MPRGIPVSGINEGWFKQGHKLMRRPQISVPLEFRFWPKVHKTAGCWLWMASCDRKGYGQIFVSSMNGKRHLMRAHRVAWMLTNGAIPDGMFLCHHCDVRRCVNPDHLFVGDNDANVADMFLKGRNVDPPAAIHGERHFNAKLTNDQVKFIRRQVSIGETQRSLAAEYGVSTGCINHIVKGRQWRSIR